MSERKTLTVQDVANVAACERLKPLVADLKRQPGTKAYHVVDRNGNTVKGLVTRPATEEAGVADGSLRRVPGPSPDGYEQYSNTITTNEDGKLTHAAHEVLERHRPAALANAERIAAREKQPGAWAGRGLWTERTVYHADGSTSVYRRDE